MLKATCICWLAAKLAGWRMFTTCRLFPTAPVFDFLNGVPAVVHTALFGLSVLCLVFLAVSAPKKKILALLLTCELISFLLDQNRIQPWDYQYLFTILIFIVFASNKPALISAFIFILASTYLYGGLSKLNNGFLQTIWQRMLLLHFLKLSPHGVLYKPLYFSGLSAGMFEILAGTGLLFPQTRKTAAGALISLHVLVLLFLGPLGINYNAVVWPWNVAMAVYSLLIFNFSEPLLTAFKSPFRAWSGFIVVCWGFLPALNFIGLWDNYLSSSIYSGKLPSMTVSIADTTQCKPLRQYITIAPGSEPATIDLQSWAMSETRMAPYPELRVYKKIQAKLENEYPGAGFKFHYSGR